MQKEEFAQNQWEDLFYQTLIELDYTKDETRRGKLMEQAATYANKVPSLQGWPDRRQAFWNGESLGWNQKIDEQVREALQDELRDLDGLNLDIGGGSIKYVPNSVIIDISEHMLALNDAKHKVHADVENGLPFDSHRFDSATMLFLVNYVGNVEQLLKEVHRVLKVGGKAIIVQSANPVFMLHRSHYKNNYELPELKILLNSIGFSVSSELKELRGKKFLWIEAEKTVKRPISW